MYNPLVSYTPPPFTEPVTPSPRKNKTPMILAIVFIALACVCLIPGYFLFKLGAVAVKEGLPMAQCGIAFEDVRNALKEYAAEHDGMLPKAETWQDDVRPYYAKVVDKHGDDLGPIKPMEADSVWGCTTSLGKTGIAFNRALSGKKLADIKDPKSTVLIFETTKASTNVNEEYTKREQSTGPKIMGEHRDWMVMFIDGEPDFKVGKNFESK